MRLLSQVERSGSTWVKCLLVLGSRWSLIQMRVWGSKSSEVLQCSWLVVNESLHNTKFNCRSQLLTFSYIFIYSFIITSNNFFFQLSISLSCCPKTSPMFNASGVFHVQLQIWKERNKKVLWIFFTCEVKYNAHVSFKLNFFLRNCLLWKKQASVKLNWLLWSHVSFW